jgi:broad specificity phosphatase PhoE
MKFILVRHAQTTANTKSVILGGKEGGELSERGKKQARALAKRLKGEKFSEIYTSSANRARQTCEAITSGSKAPLYVCDELREIDMGDLVGLSHERAEEKYPSIFTDIFVHPEKRIPGGESINDVQARVMPLIGRLAQKPGNPTVLAVGHNVVNRVILASLLGLPYDRAKGIKQKNVAWSLLDVKPNFAALYCLDNSLHAVK